MLDIKFIRENPDKIKEACKKKQAKVDIDRVLELDKERREIIQHLEQLRAQHNKISRTWAIKGGYDAVDRTLNIGALIGAIKDTEKKLKKLEKKFDNLMLQIPNLPLDDVPVGKDESENVVIRKWGEKTKFDFQPLNYLDIAEKLDIIDVQRAAKTSGSRFGFLKGEAALLEFALINLAFDTLTPRGFVPVVPPAMIKPELFRGMGYLERGDEEVYYIPKDDLYLIGTAEQIIGPMHADEVFKEKELPKRYIGFSPCFRTKEEHMFFLEMEEKLMQLLKIPHRVVKMCTGDLGDPAASKYDIEAWMLSEGKYRETHSTSNCTDFQARRLNIRYRDGKTKGLEFVHTINGTAIAIGRAIIAIIENYQQKDGSIKVPKVLRKYLSFKVIRRWKRRKF